MDEPDWGLLAGMGLGATKGLKAAGITNYAEAKDACAAVAAATGAEYELDELVCFLCLTQHKEAAHASNLPKIPPPVSLRDDLGLELPTMPIAASPRLRITQKTKTGPRHCPHHGFGPVDNRAIHERSLWRDSFAVLPFFQ